ncbi:MAG: DeoR/GlpR family DNA-binding transcription regulator [Acidobacteria bacterium]|nr:DeoR/GlpR family DNA-binding transcription regulator [Acidobacteriota bacterium]MCI0721703.1 DeoR/GlpR family DNA-binding transcription regulator [Acidobacteriota bacterium]
MAKLTKAANGGRAAKVPQLLIEERRRKILEMLSAQERVTVGGLVEAFGISAVTIRGDLDALDEQGALVRSHGGAVKRLNPLQDYPLQVKETLHHAAKVRIAQAAARLIRVDQRIILDSGTTTAETARQIKGSKLTALTVITNALNIAMELANLPDVSVIMLGGMLRQMSYSLVGPHAEQILGELNADHVFLGVDGLDPELGLSTPDVFEAKLNALMIRVARQATVVADSSKLGQRSLSVIGRVENVHRVITDNKAAPDLVEALRARGVEVILV